MTPWLAVSLSPDEVQRIEFVAVGLLVFLIFLVASRFVPRFFDDQLRKRHLPPGMVVVGRRVATVVLLALGVLAALSFAIQSANVTLLGILLATVIAAFGVQDLLKDYVSGYYVLLERHIRAGDKISMGEASGTVMEVKLRVTLLKSENGDLVVVPNSELFGKPVVVHARAEDRAVQAKVEPSPEPPK
jgi:small-conductance mechanosensitive channel